MWWPWGIQKILSNASKFEDYSAYPGI